VLSKETEILELVKPRIYRNLDLYRNKDGYEFLIYAYSGGSDDYRFTIQEYVNDLENEIFKAYEHKVGKPFSGIVQNLNQYGDFWFFAKNSSCRNAEDIFLLYNPWNYSIIKLFYPFKGKLLEHEICAWNYNRFLNNSILLGEVEYNDSKPYRIGRFLTDKGIVETCFIKQTHPIFSMFKYEDLMIQVSPKFITRQEHERKVKK
jgi:hypothetical protein